jgi:hypothetical protein
MTEVVRYGVVIPTIGRPSLGVLLRALDQSAAVAVGPEKVVVVDDRTGDGPPLDVGSTGLDLQVVRSGGKGPAAARNRGWRALPADVPWVVFLDDDVIVSSDWCERLQPDLALTDAAPGPDHIGASSAILSVPRVPGRRPTDDERRTIALDGARWITADMAYRRDVLDELDGFDERFPRAYREDSDLALRAVSSGWTVAEGRRVSIHPLKRGPWWLSVRNQDGNADDSLLRAKFGPKWRSRIGEGGGRMGRHLVASTAALTFVVAVLHTVADRPGRLRGVALGSGLVWAALTAEFAMPRIRSGPPTPKEVAIMIITSAVIPPVAVYHRARAAWRWRSVPLWRPHTDT